MGILCPISGAELEASHKPRRRKAKEQPLQTETHHYSCRLFPEASRSPLDSSLIEADLGSLWIEDPERYEEMLRRMFAGSEETSSGGHEEEGERTRDSAADLEEAYLQVWSRQCH